MPPRSFYVDPRSSDYLALLSSRGTDAEVVALAEEFYSEFEVPFIDNFTELSAYIGVEVSVLFNILRTLSKHYRNFEIQHFSGKVRSIDSPRTYLKVIQWWILDNILSKQEQGECVHGFVKDKSYYSNAKFHFGATHLLTVDIKDFFPSITHRQVTKSFVKTGYSREASAMLASYCTLDNRLPQGAPTSPALSNLVFADVDEELLSYAEMMGFKYTRYADDLTFSHDSFIEKSCLDVITATVEKFGFKLNDKKTKFCGGGDRMEVTGIVINDKLQLPRLWRNKARAMFFQANNSPEKFAGSYEKIQGVLNTLVMFNEGAENSLINSGKSALKKISSLKQSA